MSRRSVTTAPGQWTDVCQTNSELAQNPFNHNLIYDLRPADWTPSGNKGFVLLGFESVIIDTVDNNIRTWIYNPTDNDVVIEVI